MCDLRTCIKCKAQHPVSFFNRDCTRQSGLHPWCKDCTRKAARISYRTHETDHRALKQRWKDANRERHREINRAWGKANADKSRQKTARYQARLKQATPPWVDHEIMEFIRSECPPGYHIDHIHPLYGKTFCGLNVPWNLQYLPAAESFRKGFKPPVEAGGHYNV